MTIIGTKYDYDNKKRDMYRDDAVSYTSQRTTSATSYFIDKNGEVEAKGFGKLPYLFAGRIGQRGLFEETITSVFNENKNKSASLKTLLNKAVVAYDKELGENAEYGILIFTEDRKKAFVLSDGYAYEIPYAKEIVLGSGEIMFHSKTDELLPFEHRLYLVAMHDLTCSLPLYKNGDMVTVTGLFDALYAEKPFTSI